MLAPSPEQAEVRAQSFWRIALEQFDTVTAIDLHQYFGIDTGLPETWARPWWWLRSRILGLADIPDSRLHGAASR